MNYPLFNTDLDQDAPCNEVVEEENDTSDDDYENEREQDDY